MSKERAQLIEDALLEYVERFGLLGRAKELYSGVEETTEMNTGTKPLPSNLFR